MDVSWLKLVLDVVRARFRCSELMWRGEIVYHQWQVLARYGEAVATQRLSLVSVF